MGLANSFAGGNAWVWPLLELERKRGLVPLQELERRHGGDPNPNLERVGRRRLGLPPPSKKWRGSVALAPSWSWRGGVGLSCSRIWMGGVGLGPSRSWGGGVGMVLHEQDTRRGLEPPWTRMGRGARRGVSPFWRWRGGVGLAPF